MLVNSHMDTLMVNAMQQYNVAASRMVAMAKLQRALWGAVAKLKEPQGLPARTAEVEKLAGELTERVESVAAFQVRAAITTSADA